MYNDFIVCQGENLSYVFDYLIRITVHYTDSYATDMLIYINSIQEQLINEEYEVAHTWYFGIYKNGVQREESLETLKSVNTRRFRAIYSFNIEPVINCGVQEPEVKIVRIDTE